jgi:hypothetical protein
MTAHPLMGAIEELRNHLEETWDADDSMADEYVMSLPIGQFVQAAHSFDPEVLCWLTYFVARRGLARWEESCRDPRPREIVDRLGRFLRDGAAVNWDDAVRATPTPHRDCLYSETQSASDAVAECGRYIVRREPRHAVYCISAADVAYNYVPAGDQFRRWLVELAIPVALNKREMTEVEREAERRVRRSY